VALIDSGTMAAHTPMVVPVTSRVSGSSATRSTMNGVARKPLTTAPTARLRRGASKKPPGAETTRKTAMGMPATSAISAETPTMWTVPSSACQRRSYIAGDIAHDPRIGVLRPERVDAGGRQGGGRDEQAAVRVALNPVHRAVEETHR